MPKVDLAIGDEKVWEESVSQSVGWTLRACKDAATIFSHAVPGD